MRASGLPVALVALLGLAVVGSATQAPTPVSTSVEARAGIVHMLGSSPALRESVGVDVSGAGDSLVCVIAPRCPHVWLGERPRFRVRITNHASREVLLVPPLDGSMYGRSPQVTFAYAGPPSGVRAIEFAVCGNRSPMSTDDFVSIRPGGSIELFGKPGIEDGAVRFSQPGVYVARFEYSTEQNDLREWLGDFRPDALGEDWRSRFRRVPRVDL